MAKSLTTTLMDSAEVPLQAEATVTVTTITTAAAIIIQQGSHPSVATAQLVKRRDRRHGTGEEACLESPRTGIIPRDNYKTAHRGDHLEDPAAQETEQESL